MATRVEPNALRRVLVVPLIRITPSLAVLSYTVPEGLDVLPGACVQVPFRTKTIDGIVWDEDRTVARKGTKNIIAQKGALTLTAEQFILAKWLAAETLTPINVILRSMVLGDGSRDQGQNALKRQVSIVECPTGSARLQVLNEWSKRIAQKATRTLIVVPNQGAATQWMAALTKLTPLHIVPTRSGMAQQRLRANLKTTKTYITTHVGLLYPLPKIERVILDLADDEGYFAFDQSPRIDIRALTEKFSQIHSASLLVLTRWMSPTLKGVFPMTVPTCIGTRPEGTIIDRENEPPAERGNLPPTYVLEKLQSTRTLWLHQRTSEAGWYTCFDCGTSVRCPRCAKPLRVYARNPLTLECLQDHLRLAAPSKCENCKGTKLTTRSPGVQQVARTISNLTGASAVATLERGLIQGDLRTALHVVSTTAVGSYPTLSFDAAVFLQPDRYFSQPGYRAAEQFFSTLALIRATLTPKGLLYIVTYKTEMPAYKFLNNPNAWTQQTLVERTELNFPPVGTMILIRPRMRTSRPAATAFMEKALPNGVTSVQIGAAWLLRTAHPLRSTLLEFLQRHLDPTWEAIVNPPALPLD